MSKERKDSLLESNNHNLTNNILINNNNIKEELFDSLFEVDAPQFLDLTKRNEISNEE